MVELTNLPLRQTIQSRFMELVGGRLWRLTIHLGITRSATVAQMSPTVARDGPFRMFFFSREEERIHVHVAHPDGEAKFWLTPQIDLADHTGLSAKQLREARSVVLEHME